MNIHAPLLAFCVIVLLGASVAAFPFPLIKEEEAALPDKPLPKTRGPVPAPIIKFRGVQRTTSPFDLVVELVPVVAAASIDIDSLQVWYSKDPPVNLTNRIAPFVARKERAVVIRLSGAEAPVGKHQIVFRVEDTYGQVAIESFDIEILPKR